jgi:hypothetical protein
MTTIDYGNGLRWQAIETQEEADREGALAKHAVAHYFRWDGERRQDDKPVSAYFSLRFGEGEIERALVTVRVPVAGAPAYEGIVVSGERNGNPFCHFDAAIAHLASVLGADLMEGGGPWKASSSRSNPGYTEVPEGLKAALANVPDPDGMGYKR